MKIKQFLSIVNGVTVFHRHGGTIPKRKLDALCKAQAELEKSINSSVHVERKVDEIILAGSNGLLR